MKQTLRQANSAGWKVNPIVHEKYAERPYQERERRASVREKIVSQSKIVVDAYDVAVVQE